MTNLIRKIFSFGELKYGWLLLVSIVLCVVTFYADEHYDSGDQFWLSVSYFISFALAALWAGVNYVEHIRINSLYRKHGDIRAYVDQLAINAEDKLELRDYLEDYATDLEQQGRNRQEAVTEAINQFRVKEFLSMSKHTQPFESHSHHYLLGYSSLAIAATLLLVLFDYAFPSYSLYALILGTVLAVYGMCFIALLVLYRILDKFIYRKLKDYFS